MYCTMSISEFLAKTASRDPVPGGGSVSALAAATAAALTEMAANLTIGRQGFEQEGQEMEAIAVQAEKLRKKLSQAIDRDAEAFRRVMEARNLPKTTDTEKMRRAEAIEDAFKEAAMVPFETARDALSVLEMSEIVVTKGNPNAVTDGAVAVMMARAAVRGALYNIKINLFSIKDKAFIAEMRRRTKDLDNRAKEKERTILEVVTL